MAHNIDDFISHILLLEKTYPDHIITTGAAPRGLFVVVMKDNYATEHQFTWASITQSLEPWNMVRQVVDYMVKLVDETIAEDRK